LINKNVVHGTVIPNYSNAFREQSACQFGVKCLVIVRKICQMNRSIKLSIKAKEREAKKKEAKILISQF
jgi:hypothetical protein